MSPTNPSPPLPPSQPQSPATASIPQTKLSQKQQKKHSQHQNQALLMSSSSFPNGPTPKSKCNNNNNRNNNSSANGTNHSSSSSSLTTATSTTHGGSSSNSNNPSTWKFHAYVFKEENEDLPPDIAHLQHTQQQNFTSHRQYGLPNSGSGSSAVIGTSRPHNAVPEISSPQTKYTYGMPHPSPSSLPSSHSVSKNTSRSPTFLSARMNSNTPLLVVNSPNQTFLSGSQNGRTLDTNLPSSSNSCLTSFGSKQNVHVPTNVNTNNPNSNNYDDQTNCNNNTIHCYIDDKTYFVENNGAHSSEVGSMRTLTTNAVTSSINTPSLMDFSSSPEVRLRRTSKRQMGSLIVVNPNANRQQTSQGNVIDVEQKGSSFLSHWRLEKSQSSSNPSSSSSTPTTPSTFQISTNNQGSVAEQYIPSLSLSSSHSYISNNQQKNNENSVHTLIYSSPTLTTTTPQSATTTTTTTTITTDPSSLSQQQVSNQSSLFSSMRFSPPSSSSSSSSSPSSSDTVNVINSELLGKINQQINQKMNQLARKKKKKNCTNDMNIGDTVCENIDAVKDSNFNQYRLNSFNIGSENSNVMNNDHADLIMDNSSEQTNSAFHERFDAIPHKDNISIDPLDVMWNAMNEHYSLIVSDKGINISTLKRHGQGLDASTSPMISQGRNRKIQNVVNSKSFSIESTHRTNMNSISTRGLLPLEEEGLRSHSDGQYDPLHQSIHNGKKDDGMSVQIACAKDKNFHSLLERISIRNLVHQDEIQDTKHETYQQSYSLHSEDGPFFDKDTSTDHAMIETMEPSEPPDDDHDHHQYLGHHHN